MSFSRNRLRNLVVAILGLVATLQFLRISQEALFNSSEVISDDYFEWIPTVDAILSGNLKGWTDCAYGSHVAVVPLLVWILNAKLLHWNLFAERLLGLLVTLAKIAITSKLMLPITRSSVLTVLLLLTICFSSTQVTVFVYPVASTVFGLATLFFLIGLSQLNSACTKTSDSRAEQVRFILTSFLSCLSAGILIPAFCSYFTLIFIHRRFSLLKCWLLAASVSALPYTAVLMSFKKASSNSLSTFNPVRILDMLGILTASDLSQISLKSFWTYTSQGLLGVVVAGYIALIFLVRTNPKPSGQSPPEQDSLPNGKAEPLAISLIVFGLSSAIVLGAFRNAVAQWHVALTSFFWIGLVFLLLKAWFPGPRRITQQKKLLCTAILTLISVCLLKANLNLAPYDYTYRARSGSAQTFVEQYRITPTYNFQFLNGGELLSISKIYKAISIAERNNWITFRRTPSKFRSLQSCFFQPEVVIDGKDGNSGLSWVKNKQNKQISPVCPEKLRFAISEGTSIYWRPLEPNYNIRRLEIKAEDNPALLQLEIFGDRRVLKQTTSKSKTLRLDLDEPANSKTTIKVTALKKCLIDEMFVLLQPHKGAYYAGASALPLPNNVDRPIQYDNHQVKRIEINRENYELENLIQLNESDGIKTFKVTGSGPKLILKNSLALPFSRIQCIRYTLKVPKSLVVPRSCIHIALNGYELKTMATAVLEDGLRHTYDFDTKFFQPAPESIITGLQIMPIFVDNTSAPIELGNVELVCSKEKF